MCLWRAMTLPAAPRSLAGRPAIDLGSLAGPAGRSIAYAVNDAGQVVGTTQVTPGGPETGAAFLITPEDTDRDGSPDRWFRDDDQYGVNDLMTALAPSDGHNLALDINAAGQAVGTSGGRAVLWQDGNTIDLGSLTGTAQNKAFGINDAGQVVGSCSSLYTAFLLSPEDTDGDGAPDRWYRDSDNDGGNDLMVGLGGPGVTAAAINVTGHVVAKGGSAPFSGGFLWTPAEPNGTRGTLQPLNFSPADVSATGEFVGTLTTADWTGAYSAEGYLGDMIPPDSGWAGLYTAEGINDGGRIVGWGSTGALPGLGLPAGADQRPPPPVLSITDATVTEGNTGTGSGHLHA